jgi:excisionase family DNA binding protein
MSLTVSEKPRIQRRTLTVKQTADYLGLCEDTIYNMVREKQIPHFRSRRRILFTVEAIDSWIRDQEDKAMRMEEAM